MRLQLSRGVKRLAKFSIAAGIVAFAGASATVGAADAVTDAAQFGAISEAQSTVLTKPTTATSKMVVSQRMKDITPKPNNEAEKEREIRRLPLPASMTQIPLRPAPGSTAAITGPSGLAGPLVAATTGINFAGLGQGDYGFNVNSAPPDTTGAVGATQYVQWVNTSLVIFDKASGARLVGPISGNQIFANLGSGNRCATTNDGDPIVSYDKAAARWVLTQFVASSPYLQCVAVSQTSDATGAYNLYSFTLPQFGDYPKVGVWTDAYYISFNVFTSTFQGARACAYDRARMLAGQTATQVCFQLSSSFGGLLPSDLDGSTPPPAGSPNYFTSFGSSRINVWRFHVDFATPTNSTFTGPTVVTVPAFTTACGNSSTCIPQPGTSNQLDSLSDRLMFRLAYRNRAGTQSLLMNHSVRVGNRRTSPTGVRWYEIRLANQTPSLYQQGTYSPDTTHRWMGSIAMDKVGNIGLGYSASSSSVFPSIRYTGRAPTDALGTLSTENTIITGSGSQTGSLHRWGDYSTLTVDPIDDCTFWYTQEYGSSNGSFNWKTRIASFRFPSCS
ncbi:MAG: hypothetical protein M0P19_05465 [Nevskia sp.]|jgi:hypothetical protein|nr:hypothetical protein [Nevskia sp.]